MEKKTKRRLVVILVLLVLWLAILVSSMRKPQVASLPMSEPQIASLPIPEPAPVPEIVSVPTPEPEVIEAEAYSEPEEALLALEPVVETPKTMIVERTIRSGNKGYTVLEKKYVYFGIETTYTEEVPVE